MILKTKKMLERFTKKNCKKQIKKSLGGVNVELYLSNYAAKSDLKNVTEDDTSEIAKKVDLASLKFNVDKLDIDKLKNVLTNLNNLKNKVDFTLANCLFGYVKLTKNADRDKYKYSSSSIGFDSRSKF